MRFAYNIDMVHWLRICFLGYFACLV